MIDPVAFSLSPFDIRWYALAYIAGILLGWALAHRLISMKKLWPSNTPPLSQAQLSDFISWLVLGIIIGGRLGYVLFYNPAFYIENPLKAFYIWEGGMSFHGGLLGVIGVILIFARKHRLNLMSFLDLAAVSAPIGLFFGRLANFTNGELWGRVSDVHWGVVFPFAGDLPRHPSQLYQAGLEGLLLFCMCMICVYYNRLKYCGFLTGVFGIGYGLSRFFVEFFREPDPQIGFIGGFITMGQILSLPMIFIGIGFILYTKRKNPYEQS